MKSIIILSAIILASFNTIAQIKDVEEKFDLPPLLNESSGAIFFNDKLITHNDSGNENKLYELDTLSGQVTRTVSISNATNRDWEDITQDESSIYIGDIGNNNGDRTDLKIYKIAKSDYRNSTSVTADIINFSYSDQMEFESNPNNTEWDAEALISLDSTTMILFTKNWVTGRTKAYPIPKESGTYSVDPMPSTLNSGGLITGGTFNPSSEKLYLIGHNLALQPFVWECDKFEGHDIFSGTQRQTVLTGLGTEQTEAITYAGPNSYFLTSESFNIPPLSDNGKLISFTTNDMLVAAEQAPVPVLRLYPNPVRDILYIDGPDFTSVEIYDSQSRLMYRGYENRINVSTLTNGLYLVKLKLTDRSYLIQQFIVE